MIKRTAILVTILVLVSSAFGQYNAQAFRGRMDATPYLANNNGWVNMPTKSIIGMAHGTDDVTYVLDASGCVWSYDTHARTYTQQTALGCGFATIGMTTALHSGQANSNNHYITLLKTDAACLGVNKRQYYWTETGGPTMGPNCYSYWTGGWDSYFYTDGNGVSWFRYSNGITNLGTGWVMASVVNSDMACAVKAGLPDVFYVTKRSDHTMIPLPIQPPRIGKGAGLDRCVATADGTILASDGTVTYLFNTATQAWMSISGGGFTSGQGYNKYVILANKGGQLSHLNVGAGYYAIHVTGAQNNCPGTTCNPGTLHNFTAQARLGTHHLNGALVTGSYAPTVQGNVLSWDGNFSCDLIFGDPYSSECNPTTSVGKVQCSQTLAILANLPAVPAINESLDARAFSGAVQSTDAFYVGIGWVGQAACRTFDACAPYTSAICNTGVVRDGIVDINEIVYGPEAGPTEAMAAATAQCLEGETPNAWRVRYTYEAGDVTTCTARDQPIPVPGGYGVISCY